MSEPRTAAATARRRADSDHKRHRVLTVAGAFIDRGQDFSFEQLARAAQVNPGFVHRAPGLKAEIAALRDNGEALGRTMLDAYASSDPVLSERVAELEQQLFEANEALRERDEQLQAVRTLNQRLLKEHNVQGAR